MRVGRGVNVLRVHPWGLTRPLCALLGPVCTLGACNITVEHRIRPLVI